ncbi:hypothetical protein SOPP22_04485 [Shewanella sp. OPT22]|nr:hypothetical protein SOPP22_04485 [Shewanella sp. OPT22]
MEVKHFNILASVFLFFTIIGYLFLDKSIALYFLHNFSDANITHFSHKLASWTSSKKICFLGLLICAITFIQLLKNKINLTHPLVRISAIYALSITVVFVIKGVIARYRPELYFSDDLYGFHFFSAKHAFTSMPSGHAITAFTLLLIPGMFLWCKNKLLSIIFIFCALFLAFSRILTTDHYFSDVMFSFAIASYVAGYIFSKVPTQE